MISCEFDTAGFILLSCFGLCRLVETMSRRLRPRSRRSLLSRLWPKLLMRGCSAGWSSGSIRRWTRPRGKEPPSSASSISLGLRSSRYDLQGFHAAVCWDCYYTRESERANNLKLQKMESWFAHVNWLRKVWFIKSWASKDSPQMNPTG